LSASLARYAIKTVLQFFGEHPVVDGLMLILYLRSWAGTVLPCASTAQVVRAILFAIATIATFKGRRLMSCCTQALRVFA
jgi:hypothetical protein